MSEKAKDNKGRKFPALCRIVPTDPAEAKAKKYLEKQIFTAMASLYCRAEKHPATRTLSELQTDPEIAAWIRRSPRLRRRKVCDDCLALIEEAFRHTDRCPHTTYKTFCHRCPTPCYAPRQRAAMRPVMGHAGPRLMLWHPILAAKFLKNLFAAKRKLKKYAEQQALKTKKENL